MLSSTQAKLLGYPVGFLLGVKASNFMREDQEIVLAALAVLHLIAQQRLGAKPAFSKRN